MYDAIVIGARCAGSPTGMLLAKRGRRVLIVDKATFPSDVISTHFLHPRGSSYLRRWGLLDRVIAAGTPTWDRHSTTVNEHNAWVPRDHWLTEAEKRAIIDFHGKHPLEGYRPLTFMMLDRILAAAAEEAGAEVRLDFEVTGLLREGDRVTGIEGRTSAGATAREQAKVVVGADGRRSSVARWVGAEERHHRPRCTYAYYSYWEGLSLDGLSWPLHLHGRQGLAVYPTNDGLIHVVVFGPREWWEDFKRDLQGNFQKAARMIYPALADRLEKARRVEKLYGTADQENRFYISAGQGWALVGDAGLQQDQCTAIGMTHAFRDAELLSAAIEDGLSGRRPLDEALADYQRRRDADSVEYHEFVCALAECNPARLDQELAMFAAMRENPAAISRFFSVFGDILKPSAFFAPDNLGPIFAAARRDLPDPEIFRTYDAHLARATQNPWQPSA